MSIRRSSVRWRAGSTALLVTATAIVLVVAVLTRPGLGSSGGTSPAPAESAPAPSPILPSPSSPGFAVGRAFATEVGYGEFAVGRIGGPSLRLPPGEQVLAVSQEYEAARVLTGAAGSLLVVRDIATGRQVVRLERPEMVGTAVFAGGSLYFTGSRVDSYADPGVSAVDLVDLNVREVIPPTTWPVEWNGTGSRNQLRVSPTGATVGAPACGPAGPGGPKRCFIDIIDVTSGTVTRPVTDIPLYLWDVNDTTLFAVPDERTLVAAFDRQTGGQRWQADAAEFVDHYPTSDGRTYVVTFVVPGDGAGTPSSWVLAAIDTADGNVREVYRVGDEPRTLWPELSDDRFAVVGRVNALLSGTFGNGRLSVSADVVELATGQVFPAALTIPSPVGP